MATVLQAAQAATAARSVALAQVAEALVSDQSRIDDAQQAYDGGLAAELGKWPSWVKFAETVGVKAADLNYSSSDKAQVDAFGSALSTIMDMVLKGPHDAWTSGSLAATREQEKQHRKAGRTADADACKREAQSAATRRTELANVIRYGASIGRYVLDRMTQERELAGVHKATVWAAVFSGCNRKCGDIRDAGGTITEGDLYSVAAAVLDGTAKPEKTDDEKRSAVAAALNKAVGKASEMGLLSVDEVRKIRAVLDRNPETQERATDAEAAVKPVTRKSDPAPAKPAPAPKAGKPAPKAGKPAPKAGKPAKPAVETKAASDATKIAADVI
jgi:hypothetical protein